jgi:hypothetical protein
VFLTLIPAIRRGAAYVEQNGSPWIWPLYPWTLFVFLGLGVCARSFYLCVSMHAPSYPETEAIIFAPYFLVPFLFAISILLLEAGIVSQRRGVLRAALLAPVGLLVLCMIGQPADAVSRVFLGRFMHALGGSPLYLGSVGVLLYYGYAAFRRVPRAIELLTIAIVAFSVVSPSSVGLNGLVDPSPWVICGAGALQGVFAARRRDPIRGLVAATCFVAAATLTANHLWPNVSSGVVAYHLALAAILALGTIFNDVFARVLRCVAALMIIVAAYLAIWLPGDPYAGVPAEWFRLYALGASALALAYGRWFGVPIFRYAGALCAAGWFVVTGCDGYSSLRRSVAGLDHIAWGLGFFLIAAVISLSKAGVIEDWWIRRTRARADGAELETPAVPSESA